MKSLEGFLSIDRQTGDLEGQIYRGLRNAILTGHLAAGHKLPATRPLSQAIGVARSTIVTAFERLQAEGYIRAVQGSFTRVSDLSPALIRPQPQPQPAPPAPQAVLRGGLEENGAFSSGVPDLAAFPRSAWARCLGTNARSLTHHDLGYAAPEGLAALREAILAHVADRRGLAATPEQVIIVPSTSVALDLIARLVLQPGDTAWIEEPGYPAAVNALRNAGALLVPVPCDGQGILLPASGTATPRLIYVTPSHQYPTGVTMSLSRRLLLLDEAARTGAVILEDDYDSEFQYGGRPIAALQGIDHGISVAYLGTFSKVLAPGICVAYAILPPWLLERLNAAPWHRGLVPIHVQAALADFLNNGHLRAHIRRMNAIYHARMDAALAALRRHCGDVLVIPEQKGGLQLAAFFRDNAVEDAAFAASLKRHGIDAKPLSQFYLGPPRPGLLLGISSTSPAQADQAARRIRTALKN